MKVGFLLDENLPPRLKLAILRLNSEIDILRVGEDNAPPTGTLDPDILRYLQLSQRVLVTDNRASMPGHLEVHWGEGGHIWGLFWLRPRTPIAKIAQELVFVWEATEAEEWIDKNDQIWIEEDWTEEGIANELMKLGISNLDIVLAFHPPEERKYTEFATA